MKIVLFGKLASAQNDAHQNDIEYYKVRGISYVLYHESQTAPRFAPPPPLRWLVFHIIIIIGGGGAVWYNDEPEIFVKRESLIIRNSKFSKSYFDN